MKNVINVINELRATNSNKDKQIILERNKDVPGLKEVLEYTYNPFKKYGITDKTFKDVVVEKSNMTHFKDIFKVADKLEMSNINNELRVLTVSLVENLPNEEEKDLAKCILCKDLRAGITSTTINKVFEGLIPKFEVQLATSIERIGPDYLNGEKMYVTEKFDGIRCVCIIRSDDDIKFYSRNGKEITGLNDIVEMIKKIKIKNQLRNGLVLDGELLKMNVDNLNSGDLYRETVSIVNSKSNDKKGICYNVFDWIPLDHFMQGMSCIEYSERRDGLDSLEVDGILVKVAPIIYVGHDLDRVMGIAQRFIASGKEGIMINLESYYECKRIKRLIKVKGVHTVDLEVVDLEEGTGRNKDRLGALICRYKDGTTVNIGSGFSDKEREDLWVDTSIIGSIVEIRYTEESKNKEGKYSLRFPRFMGKRLDKEVADY